MDSDEEAGLRAFAVTVGAYAGASYPERPEWIDRHGARVSVTSIDARWREEERLGFRVRLADGSAWLLYYVPELDLWSGVADAAAQAGTV
ncbi:MAG: hypothetical protein HY873_03100 [Chloroflexi bacterium]|nr:hypothetical protein [Chloroflexota bacterium]